MDQERIHGLTPLAKNTAVGYPLSDNMENTNPNNEIVDTWATRQYIHLDSLSAPSEYRLIFAGIRSRGDTGEMKAGTRVNKSENE